MMRIGILTTICIALLGFSKQINFHEKYHGKNITDTLPSWVKGNFNDDYGISYSISNSIWLQHPNARYHILKCNYKEQYIIVRNDGNNQSGRELYIRIDYIQLKNMDPWSWGYCYSVYDAKNDSLAENTYKADRQDPRKGCNGFPFSRMKIAQ
jgi:hypothetical protein